MIFQQNRVGTFQKHYTTIYFSTIPSPEHIKHIRTPIIFHYFSTGTHTKHYKIYCFERSQQPEHTKHIAKPMNFQQIRPPEHFQNITKQMIFQELRHRNTPTTLQSKWFLNKSVPGTHQKHYKTNNLSTNQPNCTQRISKQIFLANSHPVHSKNIT